MKDTIPWVQYKLEAIRRWSWLTKNQQMNWQGYFLQLTTSYLRYIVVNFPICIFYTSLKSSRINQSPSSNETQRFRSKMALKIIQSQKGNINEYVKLVGKAMDTASKVYNNISSLRKKLWANKLWCDGSNIRRIIHDHKGMRNVHTYYFYIFRINMVALIL